MTISNTEGDTISTVSKLIATVVQYGLTLNLYQVSLRAEPYEIQFSQGKVEKRNTQETAVSTTSQFKEALVKALQVSVMVGHKTLFLYDTEKPDNPIELAFQQRYGDIMTYKWYKSALHNPKFPVIFNVGMVMDIS